MKLLQTTIRVIFWSSILFAALYLTETLGTLIMHALP